MPSGADVAIRRGGQERAAQQARNELAGWWATIDKSDPVKLRAEVERFFPVLVESYGEVAATAAADWYDMIYAERRSEERRVGKECSMGRGPYQSRREEEERNDCAARRG